MTALPVWCLGRSHTVVSLTPATVASDGTITDGSAKSVLLYLDVNGIRLMQENDLENIKPMTLRRKNFVPIESGTSITFNFITAGNDSSGTPTNIAADLGQSYDYLKVIITRAGRTWTGYFVIRSYSEEGNLGKNTNSLALDMVDPGSTNPTYV